jgi:hypothetical protein
MFFRPPLYFTINFLEAGLLFRAVALFPKPRRYYHPSPSNSQPKNLDFADIQFWRASRVSIILAFCPVFA